MMCMQPKRLRHTFFQFLLDLFRGFPFGKPRAIAHAQYVRVNREGLLFEPAIEHNIRGFTPHSGQPHQILAGVGHLAAIFVDQQL